MSFPDAKMPKYIPQYLICRHLAYYIGKMEDALADVLCHEVAGEAGGESLLDAVDGLQSVVEGFVVAGVGDDDFGLRDGGQVGSIDQHLLQGFDIRSLLGGEGEGF